MVIGGVDDPTTLEAIACREALPLAEDLQLQRVIVASDARQVILDINNRSRGHYGAIISKINSYSCLFQCKFNYESRKVNVEAHKLAKFSLSLGLDAMCGLVNPMMIPPLPRSVVRIETWKGNTYEEEMAIREQVICFLHKRDVWRGKLCKLLNEQLMVGEHEDEHRQSASRPQSCFIHALKLGATS